MRQAKVEVEAVNAAYSESGEGEVVLYLHGFPTSGYLWRKVMGVVSDGFRTIALDFPGFGRSDLLKTAHTWEELASWVDHFVETLAIAPVHLGVHDWGGLIGLRWACDHPEKVRSLLITDTSFRAKDQWHGMAQQWRTEGVGEQLLGGITEEGFRNMLTMVGAVPDDAAAEYWRGMDTPEKRAAKLEMYRSLDFEMLEPFEPLLPSVARGRALVVWGENDPFVPIKQAHRFGDTLDAKVTLLETGHFLQEEAGEELGRQHLQFLQENQ